MLKPDFKIKQSKKRNGKTFEFGGLKRLKSELIADWNVKKSVVLNKKKHLNEFSGCW